MECYDCQDSGLVTANVIICGRMIDQTRVFCPFCARGARIGMAAGFRIVRFVLRG